MLVPGGSAYPDGQERLFIDEINQQPDLIGKATVKFAINVFFSLYLSAVNCRFRAKGMAMTFWQLIFIQSKVNGGVYDGDRLLTQNWKWPQRDLVSSSAARTSQKPLEILQTVGATVLAITPIYP
jgi:hypothetical protein